MSNKNLELNNVILIFWNVLFKVQVGEKKLFFLVRDSKLFFLLQSMLTETN